jgi:HK97 gp10 family phage protein
MPGSVSISGSTALKGKFDQLSAIVQGRTLERAIVSGALLIQNEAKRRVPKLTGNLSRSIHIGGHEDMNPGGAGVINTTGAGVPGPEIATHSAAVYVGTDVIYGPPVEFGTSKMGAQPYMRPAFDGQRAAAVQECGAALIDLIRAVL